MPVENIRSCKNNLQTLTEPGTLVNMTIKVGFTGSRWGMTVSQKASVRELLERFIPSEVHAGDCIGADIQAVGIACEIRKPKLVGHPPTNPRFRTFVKYDEERKPKAYLARDHDIVAETDLLIAAPDGFTERLRSGTWSTVRAARRLGKAIAIVFPDGEILWENQENLANDVAISATVC